MPLLRAFVQSEMQTASFRIWTRVTDSISYDVIITLSAPASSFNTCYIAKFMLWILFFLGFPQLHQERKKLVYLTFFLNAYFQTALNNPNQPVTYKMAIESIDLDISYLHARFIHFKFLIFKATQPDHQSIFN